ncbi:hypothetical protein [Bradyrhizobium nanningense]|uniref:hypothetical protein n=1 Tax=Bradyrhizobium nanningense TaxID=1325118 RepID=UPI001FE1137D|nr:hypothetical protein [Bradyrhizobium nanningense]
MKAALVLLVLICTLGSVQAEKLTQCTANGFCYCVDRGLSEAVEKNVDTIRKLLAAEKAKGKAVGYLSIPLSTLGGGWFNENAKTAVETKARIEARLGASAAWVLNPGAAEFALPAGATGADYMLMWTKVLEGPDGLSELDFVYFVGPSDYARHFGLTGAGDLERLESYYDEAAKTDEKLKAVGRRAFRDYYGLRASVTFSYGSHDEWNIVRAINQKRREVNANSGLAGQMGIMFDGQPAAPGLYETPVVPGNAGVCRP